jgi:hypothetical protein
MALGQGDVKFEARPNLINTGNTPARHVCTRIMAEILPIPIPEDFSFPLPDPEVRDAGAVAPRITYALAGTVKDFVLDRDVPAIKEGDGRALCIWALVTYDDMFGQTHKTKFGQWITWQPNGRVVRYYIAGQNDSD